MVARKHLLTKNLIQNMKIYLTLLMLTESFTTAFHQGRLIKNDYNSLIELKKKFQREKSTGGALNEHWIAFL